MKGLLLVNLGTPDSPNPGDVFRYLNEFLTDERVIDIPWLQRQLLVRGAIVPIRFLASSKSYKAIWTERGSPLRFHSEDATRKLAKVLEGEWQVELAMRYQNPSIKEKLQLLRNCSEIVVLPLFPQYASATTGSVVAKVMEEVSQWSIIPQMRFIDTFYDMPEVITAYAAQAKHLDLASYDKILFSFHGLPVRQLTKANSCCKKSSNCCQTQTSCYSAQCFKTADLLAEELNLRADQWELCFQSRLGKEPWLQPYTSDTLKRLREEGIKNILVFCPSFVADCLETIHEIGVEYAEEFKHLGGERLDLVPSLNDSEQWIEALQAIVLKPEHASASLTCGK